MIDTILRPLKEDDQRDWIVTINGKRILVNILEIYNPNFGKITYGKHPRGYDGWFFAENQGGGAIIVIYFFHNGKLFVSMLLENRANMSGEVFCGIGGYLEENSDHPKIDMGKIVLKKTDVSELDIKKFSGKPINTNRSVFMSSENEALDCYYSEISSKQVMLDPNNENFFMLKNSSCEKLKFVEWSKAMDYSQDAFICILGYQLLSKLYMENKISFHINP
jgi:hypothetical protein